jgi:large subunit ribosomal protein L25
MDITILDVQNRGKDEVAKDLRAQGMIPAEFYGKGIGNVSVKFDYQNFRRVFRKAGQNTIIELRREGEDPLNVLVHDVQYDPVTDSIKHVDFVNVVMGQKLQTKIPLEFVGQAPAVKEQSGVLTPHLHEVEVECLPRDLIHNIEVSIESLVEFNDSIKVEDLVVPDTIRILNDLEEVVVTCSPPREEEVEAPVVAEGAEATENAEVEEKSE